MDRQTRAMIQKQDRQLKWEPVLHTQHIDYIYVPFKAAMM